MDIQSFQPPKSLILPLPSINYLDSERDFSALVALQTSARELDETIKTLSRSSVVDPARAKAAQARVRPPPWMPPRL